MEIKGIEGFFLCFEQTYQNMQDSEKLKKTAIKTQIETVWMFNVHIIKHCGIIEN